MRNTMRLAGMAMLLVTTGISAFAHGTSLKIDKTSAAPGEVITLKGEGISENGEIKLTLTGIQDYALGTAQGDEHGRFEKQITLPADVRPGNYTLLAEGKAKASAKLKIEGSMSESAGATQPGLPPASMDHPTGMPGMEMNQAQAGPMEVQRPTGAAETALRWGIILASVIVGLALHRGLQRKVKV
jgi:hypothetical protein